MAIPAKGQLFWKVFDPAGEPLDSGSASFSPEPRRNELNRARNEVREGSEKATIYFQDKDKPPAVTFLYKPERGAVKYRVLQRRRIQLQPSLEGDLPGAEV